MLADYAARQAAIDALAAQLRPLRRAQAKDLKKIKAYMADNCLMELQAGEYLLTRQQKYRFSCNEQTLREEFDADAFIQDNTKEVWQFKVART